MTADKVFFFYARSVIPLFLITIVKLKTVFGVVSVVVPWFFFMPATGTGLMARLSPNPRLACGLALKMHAIFGVALGTGFAMLAA